MDRQFWGCAVNEETGVSVDLDGKALHVNQVALAPGSKGPMTLLVSTGARDAAMAVCTLSKALPHAMLELAFYPADESVSLSAMGSGVLHVSGQIADAVEEEPQGPGSMGDVLAMLAAQRGIDLGEESEEESSEESEESEEEDDSAAREAELEMQRKQAALERRKAAAAEKKRLAAEKKAAAEKAAAEKAAAEKKKAAAEKKKGKKRKAEEAAAPEEEKRLRREAAPKIMELKGGMRIVEHEQGSGKPARPGQRVTVHYTGKLTNGKQFDSSRGRGPFTFKLGAGEVIRGWDMGVKGMKPGSKRKLIIPAKFGYGRQGAPPDIPPNAKLIFEVELLRAR